MKFSDLTEELKAKARACKTPEELVNLAKEEGIDLSDEQLAAINGGKWQCPACERFDECPPVEAVM